MNVVVWARVSSREQREGYSIDAQLRAVRDRADANGWKVIREFVVAESAKRGAERVAFKEMFEWVRTHARREKIGAILSHKLDRVCRNMKDAVRLQELEDDCGVGLAFVDNQFGPGAAGALSFNVMAAVAQYYSDNLRSEVLKGIDERVRQGWSSGHAPYGYMNATDRDEPIQPHPDKSRTLSRIFELYSSGGYTFESLADQLRAEGHVFRASCPRFHRSALSYILRNRFYIGELHRNGQVFQGGHRLLIDRATFEVCQDVMDGRNRRTGKPSHPLAGGLFECVYCGQSLTGERIRRRLKGGACREHLYYRCANNRPGPDHTRVRWKSGDLEDAIMKDLDSMRIADQEVAQWFRNELRDAVEDLTRGKRDQTQTISKRKQELKRMQERLLNAYLTGSLDAEAFARKSHELKAETAMAEEALDKVNKVAPERAALAIDLFDWTQNAAEIWRRSNNTTRRQILDAVCLNRTVSDVNLYTTKRKPFDVLAKGLDFEESRGDKI